jgi:hypothetical protein
MAARAVEILDGAHTGLGTSARRMVERDYPWVETLRRLDPLVAPL